MNPEWKARYETAIDVARHAAQRALRYFHESVAVEWKHDQSPVTIADRETEQELRTALQDRFPGDGFLGEEYGDTPGTTGFRWVLDPIDGTRSFVRGYPMFSTQIALMHRGELVLGVSSASEFGELAWARKGGGAYLDAAGRDGKPGGPRPIRVASTSAFDAQTAISFGNVKTLSRGPGWNALAGLIQRCGRTRGYGDFYHYHLLARGSLDLVIESDVNILDIAALAVIVREAGGTFTDLAGRELTLATTSVLAGTPALHEQGLGLGLA